MTLFTKNQVIHTIKQIALWLYVHADDVCDYLKNALDVLGLLIGLSACYWVMLVGGAL